MMSPNIAITGVRVAALRDSGLDLVKAGQLL